MAVGEGQKGESPERAKVYQKRMFGAKRTENIDFLLSVSFSTFKNIFLHELNIFYFPIILKNSYNLN